MKSEAVSLSRTGGSPPLEKLSGFQRDLLAVITKLDEQQSSGIEIKCDLTTYYDEEVNQARLYQNLRALIDEELVETRPIDGRTKAYQVTQAGREWLTLYQDWITVCLCEEDEQLEADDVLSY